MKEWVETVKSEIEKVRKQQIRLGYEYFRWVLENSVAISKFGEDMGNQWGFSKFSEKPVKFGELIITVPIFMSLYEYWIQKAVYGYVDVSKYFCSGM